MSNSRFDVFLPHKKSILGLILRVYMHIPTYPRRYAAAGSTKSFLGLVDINTALSSSYFNTSVTTTLSLTRGHQYKLYKKRTVSNIYNTGFFLQ